MQGGDFKFGNQDGFIGLLVLGVGAG